MEIAADGAARLTRSHADLTIDCGARIGKAAWLWGIGLQGNGLRDNRAQRHDLLCL